MRLEKNEFILVGLIIIYIAFFTRPPPSFVALILESPVGHAFFLLLILYMTAYQSLVGGIFLGIAYLMSSSRFTEHLTTLDSYKETPEINFQGMLPGPMDAKTNLSAKNTMDAPVDQTTGKLIDLKTGKETDKAASKDRSEKITSSGGDPMPDLAALMGSSLGSSKSTGLGGSISPMVTKKSDGNIDFSALKGMDLTKPVSVYQAPPKPAEAMSNKSKTKAKEKFGNFAAF